ncbi:MAG TPA: phosphatase PAP2 family protein [Gemmatimonadaceae bacterium]|nr:phosphatase PAP2 family protein [Gemmatimonadaceae bacterium]
MAAATRIDNSPPRFKPVTAALVLSAALGTASSEQPASPARAAAASSKASTSITPAETNVSVHWNEIARSLVASHNTNGPMASRVYALVSVAQIVAVGAVDAATQQRGRDEDWSSTLRAAVAKASADVLSGLYPDSAIAAVPTASRGSSSTGDAIGASVARIVLAGAATDGASAANCPATPPLPPSQFWHDDAAPPDPQALLPCFGNVRTWLQLDVTRFHANPPPPVGSPAFLQGVAAVRQISDTRTAARLATVDKWLDGNNSLTPAGRWNLIASDLITRYHLGDADAARVFGVLNVAMMDTHIACWDRKFAFWELRPWQVDPLITTPRGRPHHPGNPSGHACAGGAGSGILAGFFPSQRDSLFALGFEEGFTTVQSGVHFRFDVDEGLQMGRTIAARALALNDLAARVRASSQR